MKKTLISTILATALISTMIATVANASVTEDNILINLNSSVETNIEEIDYASMISSIQLPVLVENLKTYMEENPNLTDEEIKPMAEDIGVGAIRFFIAKLSPEKHLTFKWDEALSFERGCASIQYAHARACKLLKKSGKDISSLSVADDWVPDENEKDLIRTIAKFPQVIEDCANKKRIHNITQYCQDLAGAFNKFYKAEQVIGSDVEDTRLVLVDRAKTTLKNALDILGVPAPQKM